ncbi:MAG TPA: aldehyde dehydrogenase [Hyphomicrobiaceae bacterium]|nr:aldehyde dehydrogenase [Hyphomicrobiaceae bacterium]
MPSARVFLSHVQRPPSPVLSPSSPVPPAGIAEAQGAFFRRGLTREIGFRVKQLEVLRGAIVLRQRDILEALKQDLGRPIVEGYTSEIAIVLHEIDFTLKGVAAWAKPRKVRTPLILFPGSSWVYREPYGSALIIAPWNYPFQLAVSPLIVALAAGNCAVVKPSEAAPHTSRLIADMIGSEFDPAYLAVVEGGIEETKALLEQRFDYIFFTGGTRVGKVVMAAAARHLTPVTLELGGKNPCIVDASADLDKAARRIAWGKFVNAGQTCIAPDFVLAERSIKPALLARLAAAIESFYRADPKTSPDFGRIVNDHHFERLVALLDDGRIVTGGGTDAAQRYIAPTIVDGVSWDHAIMQEEIFGPILPVLGFDDLETVMAALEVKPKPLALYFFSEDRDRQEEVLRRLSSGGACINDTFAQLLNLRLPFGGVGDSGMGAYHGRAGFETFSHNKSVVKRSTWIDPSIRYPPYRTPLKILRRVLPLIS